MKIAITGATGFLGSHLASRLASEGHELFLHARCSKKAQTIKTLGKKLIICDITDSEMINELVKGADIVIHTVSNFRNPSSTPKEAERINVTGTSEIYKIAIRHNVQRFIYISTIGVLGDIKESPASETTEYNPGDAYQYTKMQAEQYCLEAATHEQKTELVIIRPCSLYGPGDMRMLKMFKMLKKRIFFVIGDCKANFHPVYIDDAVSGIILAIEKPGIHRQIFIIGGNQYTSLKDYISTAAKSVGSKYPWIRLPYAPMYLLSAMIEFSCLPLKLSPPLFRRRVKFYKNDRAFNITKAKNILGYQPRVPLEEGMKRTVEWYQSNNYM